MARDESDREDLLREATALVPRMEIRIESAADPIFLGFKRDGSLAIYFGADPVYQFDAEHRLRRAYVDGDLFRTQGTTLARLSRQRTQTETVLLRNDLDDETLTAFLSRMKSQLVRLHESLERDESLEVSQIPADKDARSRFLDALSDVIATQPALAPAIKGKR